MAHVQGRRHGYVRYRDFVEAMEERSPTRLEGGRGKHGSGNRGARRKTSNANDIECLVDRLKEARAVQPIIRVNLTSQMPSPLLMVLLLMLRQTQPKLPPTTGSSSGYIS